MVSTAKKVVKKERPSGELQWRNRGGTFRMRNGKIIKPNQTFWAAQHEVPLSFRDVIVPVHPMAEVTDVEVSTSGYTLKETEDGLFHIVDGRGKVISENAMPADDAKAVLSKLVE